MNLQEFNVFDSTVKYNHCIGCGICEASCPHGAIDMTYTSFKEIIPLINEKCTQCKTCITYCPHTNEKINATMKKAINFNNPHLYGIDPNKAYVAYDINNKLRLKSASGGALSAIIKNMLTSNIIEYVIHASMKEGKIGEHHFSASISTTIKEIDEKRSSFYSPISFEKQIKKFYDANAKILVIGVPCVTRGIKNLFTNNKHYKNNTIYTAALACSHNVNGQFIDYLAESENIKKDLDFKVNLRNKDNIPDANHFKNHFYSNSYNGRQQTILKKDRFNTQFTTIWRNFYFASNICFKCSDFWGMDADISVKDAWGKWANNDSKGHSIVIFRNNVLLNQFLGDKNISKEKLSKEETTKLQNQTTIFKHKEVKTRITEKAYSINNIKNGYFKKLILSKLSKFIYHNTNFTFTNILMKSFETLLTSFAIIYKLFFSKIIKIFFYKKNFKMHRIFIVGGYGYNNTGDEAQLNSVLKNLDKYFPAYFKIVGTHNRMQTYLKHKHTALFDSPREAFFNHNSSKTYSLSSKYDYLIFTISSILIYLNAFLVRAELPTFLINAKKSALLNELKNCDLLYYSGGGYLTGDTSSRLYEGLLMIHIAKIFDNKVVMTGQTIGLWRSNFMRFLAKKAFSKVDLMTTRDPNDSINALSEIGVTGDHITYTCDDALFSNYTHSIEDILKNSNYKEVSKEFISCNIHYWGMQTTDEKDFYLKKMTRILDYVLEYTSYNIIFIPMTPSDEKTIDDFVKYKRSSRFFKLQYSYDFKVARGIIKKSKLCITMKHHPIIFALGENIPVISLYYTNYYYHKNNGALELFGASKFNIDISKEDYMMEFNKNLNHIVMNYKKIQQDYKNRLIAIKNTQSAFYDKVKDLLR